MNPDPLRQEAIRALRSAAGLSPLPGGLPDGSYDVGSELTIAIRDGKVFGLSSTFRGTTAEVRAKARCEVQVYLFRARKEVERLEKLLAAMPADGEGGAG